MTTLIALCHKGRPLVGVVTQHFSEDNQYAPVCYYSHIEHPVHSMSLDSLQGRVLAIAPVPSDRLDILVTSSRFNEILDRVTQVLGATSLIKQGGCGKKILSVIQGTGQCYYYHKAGTSRWDTAAPEALLISAGGVLTDIRGEHYDYSGEQSLNETGVIASGNKSVHA